MIIHPMTYLLNGMSPLPHLGVIRVEGEDAAKFLHGQLTQDFSLLGLSEARLAAFCSAKGRMQASFIGFKRSHGEILLVCSRDILAPTLKRLSMFVMRAKAKLTDATDQFSLLGLAGDTINSIAGHAYPTWVKADFGAANVVFLYPADGVPRALWVAPVGEPLPAGPALSTEVWQWAEVRSGIATITTPIVEAFVPQMLNYESVGGVNFKKGCYPGQEVVARSQFRGTLKRRLYLAQIATDQPTTIAVGTEIFTPEDAAQPVGQVVQVAPMPAPAPTSAPDLSKYGYAALVVLQTAVAAAPTPALQVGAIDGPALTLTPLPYALREDI